MNLTRRTALAGAAALAGCASLPEAAPVKPRPIVIAHRGASGYRPEHTLAAYRLAIRQGADFIEPDLVMTKDGVPVARHENEIGGTTDVASRPEFAARKAVKEIDGERFEGWFTEDFTLAELKTLRARERLPLLRPGNVAFDGQEQIPTFAEVVALAKEEGANAGRTIGVYPETKHPTYHERIGLPFDAPLLGVLRAAGWDRAEAPVFIQSFEVSNLRRLAGLTKVRLVQLIAEEGAPFDQIRPEVRASYRAMLTDDGLADIRTYAAGIGPQKSLIVPRDADGRSLPATDLVTRAHRAGLLVHPWTFRTENMFLPAELRRGDPKAPDIQRLPGDAMAEIAQFLALGVDGVFADFPDAAVAARAGLAQTP
jgi:glycerophosphoryl diester phosphodiesterase